MDTILGRASKGVLLEPDARDLLAAYGIAVPPSRVVATPDAAVEAARALGGRLALKLVSPGLLHKSDAGGVRLDVAPEHAAEAYRGLSGRAAALGIAPARVLVTPMVAGGLEFVVGAFRDPQFGPVVMFGLGGVDVEALADVVFRLAPIHRQDARDMLRGIRGVRLLGPLRGAPAVNLTGLEDVLLRVSRLAVDFPRIRELDLNPLVAFGAETLALDARVMLEKVKG